MGGSFGSCSPSVLLMDAAAEVADDDDDDKNRLSMIFDTFASRPCCCAHFAVTANLRGGIIIRFARTIVAAANLIFQNREGGLVQTKRKGEWNLNVTAASCWKWRR
uniref:Uncharacterized protein n=1 Tax=Grammatophora oceanica TaxID=210454 RepID=A0A7S1Y6Q8_9STRA